MDLSFQQAVNLQCKYETIWNEVNSSGLWIEIKQSRDPRRWSAILIAIVNNPEIRHEATRNHTLEWRPSLEGSFFPIVEYFIAGNGIKLIIWALNV